MPGAHGSSLALPVVNFRVVDTSTPAPPDVHNPQLVAFGYNDGQEWDAYKGIADGEPGRYLRWLRESLRSSSSGDCLSRLWSSERRPDGRADAAGALEDRSSMSEPLQADQRLKSRLTRPPSVSHRTYGVGPGEAG